MWLKNVISDLRSMTYTLLGNKLWHGSPLVCTTASSTLFLCQFRGHMRSMNDKVMQSFLIRGFAARTVTSHWARKGRAAHPLFTLSTGCQVPRWGPSVPAVHVGLRSKEVAPRPGRPCLLWPRRLRGHIISDSLTLTAAGRWHRQYVDLTPSL